MSSTKDLTDLSIRCLLPKRSMVWLSARTSASRVCLSATTRHLIWWRSIRCSAILVSTQSTLNLACWPLIASDSDCHLSAVHEPTAWWWLISQCRWWMDLKFASRLCRHRSSGSTTWADPKPFWSLRQKDKPQSWLFLHSPTQTLSSEQKKLALQSIYTSLWVMNS